VTEIFGIPVAVIPGQLMLGLVNGSFYALLSLGLAVIFGLMGVVNFAHGAFYTWVRSPPSSGCSGSGSITGPRCCSPRWGSACSASSWSGCLLRRLYRLDPLYGLLMTFGLALIVEGSLHQVFGSSGQSYPVPEALAERSISAS